MKKKSLSLIGITLCLLSILTFQITAYGSVIDDINACGSTYVTASGSCNSVYDTCYGSVYGDAARLACLYDFQSCVQTQNFNYQDCQLSAQAHAHEPQMDYCD